MHILNVRLFAKKGVSRPISLQDVNVHAIYTLVEVLQLAYLCLEHAKRMDYCRLETHMMKYYIIFSSK